MSELLAHTNGLPEISLAPGDTLVREGEMSNRALWVLVSGTLKVQKAGVAISSISRPGAPIGRIAQDARRARHHRGAVRRIQQQRDLADGRALLMNDPAITHLIAAGLAERLSFATTYLVDLKNQYGGTPGLAMVSEVLDQLANRQGGAASPGSAREPNPDY